MILRILLILLTLVPIAASSYPSFEEEITSRTNKAINCAYCHTDADGPEEGEAIPELPALSKYELNFLASHNIDAKDYTRNPILNDFGNYLINILGYDATIDGLIDFDNFLNKLEDLDFDADGISDKEEILDGTLANDASKGSLIKQTLALLKKYSLIITIMLIFLLIALNSFLINL